MMVKVKALINFKDLEKNVSRLVGDIFECSEERADFLLSKKAVEIVEEAKEDVFEKFEEEVIENVEYSKDIETIPEEKMNEAQKKSFEEKKKEKPKRKGRK